MKPNALLRCERRLAILERSENAKCCESLLNTCYARRIDNDKLDFISSKMNDGAIENNNISTQYGSFWPYTASDSFLSKEQYS